MLQHSPILQGCCSAWRAQKLVPDLHQLLGHKGSGFDATDEVRFREPPESSSRSRSDCRGSQRGRPYPGLLRTIVSPWPSMPAFAPRGSPDQPPGAQRTTTAAKPAPLNGARYSSSHCQANDQNRRALNFQPNRPALRLIESRLADSRLMDSRLTDSRRIDSSLWRKPPNTAEE